MHAFRIFLLGLCVTTSAHADIYYDWVNLPGSGGGSGFLRLSTTNISDPQHFDVFFNPTNILEVQFTFADGVTIADGVNFSPLATLQNDPVLNDGAHELVAIDGVISSGWSFLKGPGTPDLTYVRAEDGDATCVVMPCGLSNTRIFFTGPLIPRASGIGEWQLRPVPLPAPVAMFAVGIAALWRAAQHTR